MIIQATAPFIVRYVDTWDYIILAFEFVYYIFVAYYIVEEVLEIIKIGWVYFANVMNNLDIVVLLLCVMNISLNVYTFTVVSSELETLLQNPDDYADFNNLGYTSTMFKVCFCNQL